MAPSSKLAAFSMLVLLGAVVFATTAAAAAAAAPAFPPRLPGYYTGFINRVVVGDPATSSFVLLHSKNAANPAYQSHAAVLMNTASNSTTYNLVRFSNETSGIAWGWSYYEASKCRASHYNQPGQKRPGELHNATYIGSYTLNNGIHTEVVDSWNATSKIAGAVQPIRYDQTRSRGWPFRLHFYLYPTDDSWFQDFFTGTPFLPPQSAFSETMLPQDCPTSTTTAADQAAQPLCDPQLARQEPGAPFQGLVQSSPSLQPWCSQRVLLDLIVNGLL